MRNPVLSLNRPRSVCSLSVIFGLVTLLLGTLSSAQAVTFYLATDGTNSSARNGSSIQPWYSINYAMSRMANGDDLILKAGTYYPDSEQIINKAGSSSNRTVVKGADGQVVKLFGSNAGRASGLRCNASYVTIQNIEVTNYGYGGGIVATGSYNTIKSCKVYDVAWTGIQIGADQASDWNTVPTGSVIDSCSTWNCARSNQPGYFNYQGYRELGGSWSASISAVNSKNATITNCSAVNNWGEGIIMHRVRGGDSLVRLNYARDNFSVNIYVDSTTGASGNWVEVSANTAESNGDTPYYRGGAPATNFAASSENYDGIGLGSNPTQYVGFYGNIARNGGHNFVVGAWGKGVSYVHFQGNTAGASQWESYKQDGSTISNISFSNNSGF